MPCSLVGVYQRFGQIRCRSIRVAGENGGNRFLQNVEKYVPYYTASHTRRQYLFSVAAVEAANPTQKALQFLINFVTNRLVCCFSQMYAAVVHVEMDKQTKTLQ
jgi:hypothetical protein